MASQLAFYFNTAQCTGCKACQVACQDKHDIPDTRHWRRVAEFAGGEWTRSSDGSYTHNVFAYYVSVACNHCEKPICEEVCPAKAISKRADGIVLIDEDKCIGCRYCEWACPYAAPQYDEDKGKMSKCTFCSDYIDAGQAPACVAACPSRALEFGELSELRAKYGDLAELAPLPEATLTEPALVIAPGRAGKPVNSAAGVLANPEEV
ncbi:MAG: dimethylsulfoxide reductase subunit B [Chloroflexota bacterium]|jgi:anaerobic dimethyl sulfoxide reductase subunit B (iron-sulfur subunit)